MTGSWMIKLFICGYARHGKDSVAEILQRRFGLRHESSSHLAMRLFLREELKKHDLVYETEEACYADRLNHRQLWFDIIKNYNSSDLSRLSRAIFADNDIYVGIRNCREFKTAQENNVVDLSVWVDATQRLGTIEKGSITIEPSDCDFTVLNNGSYQDLEIKIFRIFSRIL